MYLVFTDESGTNKDSKIVLYGGLAVDENNLIKSEILITEIAKEFLGIENMLEVEIHFVDIFNYIFFNRLPSKRNKRENFKFKIIPLIQKIDLNKEKLTNFIIELFQFLAKLNITFLVSILNRNKIENVEGYVFKNFLNLLDTFLNEKNSYGVLIADGFYNQVSKKQEKINLFFMDINISNLNSKELLFKRILFESTSWKHKINIKDSFPLKNKFESKVYNVVGNMLFIPSNESHLIQISDILLYIIKKYSEYLKNPIKKMDLIFKNEYLEETFNYLIFKGNLKIATLRNDKDTLLLDEADYLKNI